MDLREKVLGALYGHLVGDALGLPYEFCEAGDIPRESEWDGYGRHGQPSGTWSDDGALMLCHVASLLDRGGFDPADTAVKFVRWLYQGYMAVGGNVFDVGTTTRFSIDRLHDGVPPLEAGPADEGSNGNGSLMRILPVSLWTLPMAQAEQVTTAHSASRLTHGHERSQVCCAFHSLYVTELLRQGVAGAWGRALEAARHLYTGMGPDGERFSAELRVLETHEVKPGGMYVVDTLLSAIQTLEASEDYASAAWGAVRLGGDTDTTAAVTGGLAGFAFGTKSIPVEWKWSLRMEPEHHELLDRFADAVCRAIG